VRMEPSVSDVKVGDQSDSADRCDVSSAVVFRALPVGPRDPSRSWRSSLSVTTSSVSVGGDGAALPLEPSHALHQRRLAASAPMTRTSSLGWGGVNAFSVLAETSEPDSATQTTEPRETGEDAVGVLGSGRIDDDEGGPSRPPEDDSPEPLPDIEPDDADEVGGDPEDQGYGQASASSQPRKVLLWQRCTQFIWHALTTVESTALKAEQQAVEWCQQHNLKQHMASLWIIFSAYTLLYIPLFWAAPRATSKRLFAYVSALVVLLAPGVLPALWGVVKWGCDSASVWAVQQFSSKEFARRVQLREDVGARMFLLDYVYLYLTSFAEMLYFLSVSGVRWSFQKLRAVAVNVIMVLLRRWFERLLAKYNAGLDKIKTKYKEGRDKRVDVFGMQVPFYWLLGAAFAIALILVITIRAIVKKTQKVGPKIKDQAFGLEWSNFINDQKRRSLLSAALFVTSLISLGNLKLFRTWMPVISFMGWMQDLVGNFDNSAMCVKGPKGCVSRLPLGPRMCGECAAAAAIRTVDSVRFTGAKRFDAREKLAALCEDVAAKTSTDWFFEQPEYMQVAILPDSQDREDLKNKCLEVTIINGNVARLKTRRSYMEVQSLKHKGLMISAGLLTSKVFLADAEVQDPVKGLGWRVSATNTPTSRSSRSGSTSSEGAPSQINNDYVNVHHRHERKSDDDRPRSAPKLAWSKTEHFDILPTIPSASPEASDEEEGKVSDDPNEAFCLFPRASSPTESIGQLEEEDLILHFEKDKPVIYQLITLDTRVWPLKFKMWKNQHTKLSKALDAFLALIVVFIVFMALAVTYKTLKGWFSSYFYRATAIRLESSIEDEGTGRKSAHVKRAEGRKEVRVQHEPEVGLRAPRDSEYDRKGPGLADIKVSVATKNFIFYSIDDILKHLAKGESGGLQMQHPSGLAQRVTSVVQFKKLLNDGWRPVTGSLGAPSIKIPLDVWRTDADLRRAVKIMHWHVIHPLTKVPIPTNVAGVIKRIFDKYGSSATPSLRTAMLQAMQPKDEKQKPTSREVEEFQDFMKGEVMVTSELVDDESNVQLMSDLRCPNVANGLKCKNKNCNRCALVAGVEDEALIGPQHLEIDTQVVHKIQYRTESGTWVDRGATCFSGPMGLYSVKHAFFDPSGDLFYPLDQFRIVHYFPETVDGDIVYREQGFTIDPLSIRTPRPEQLPPGMTPDFIIFNTTDEMFKRFCAKHRVYLGKLQEDEKIVRLVHYPSALSSVPVVDRGNIKKLDRDIGLLAYDISTSKGDSGAPAFNASGRCIGVHKGAGANEDVNYCLLLCPNAIVSWFTQSEPKNW